jgi:molybdopterin synthase sulfur carrier subunit
MAGMPDTSLSTRVAVRVVYLARLRDVFGSSGEVLALDDRNALCVDSIVSALRDRGGAWARELASDRAVRFAVNHRLAHRTQAVADGDEVAIFPPVTGG